MKLLLRCLLMLLLLTAGGCGKNEMTLSFDLSSDVNTPCRIVYYASAKGGGMLKETVAQITAGKGEIKLPQVYPSILYFFSPSHSYPSAIVYAGRGDHIVATGKGNDIAKWEFKGNAITDQLTEWRLKNASAIASRSVDSVNEAVSRFVDAHPDSPASAILLYIYFSRRNHEEEFFKLQSKLAGNLLSDQKLMGALAVADLMTSLPDAPLYPSRFVLTGKDGFADTLLLKDGKATFLMFSNMRSTRGSISADSLKTLLAKRNGKTVAEVFMDGDSLNWRRHIAEDSVSALRRLWMPLGTTDSLAISMGVRRTPYYIVFDSGGKPVYRGDNWKEASAKFESLSP